MSEQPSLNFEPDGVAIKRAYLRGQLAEAKSPAERDQIKAELYALDNPKPGATWNGKIWVSDDDLPF